MIKKMSILRYMDRATVNSNKKNSDIFHDSFQLTDHHGCSSPDDRTIFQLIGIHITYHRWQDG